MDSTSLLMKIVSMMMFFGFYNILTVSSQDLSVSREYCRRETFNATCLPGEVILMQSARYGRMDIGRCVKRDLGYLGCATDVLGILDKTCSGRQRCEFKIPSDSLHVTKPCPEDTTSYLEATHTCIRVSQLSGVPPRCSETRPLILNQPSGFISSSLTSLWNIGTDKCPWRVQAAPGQRINITLYNFNTEDDQYDAETIEDTNYDLLGPRPEPCYEYGSLRDGQRSRPVSQCPRRQHDSRISSYYVSTSHEVTVALVTPHVLDTMIPLLMKYEVVGCPDISPPPFGRLVRKEDNVTITCDNGNEIWYLTCRGTKWQGQVGNCTKGFEQPSEFPFGILLVVAIGVALGVFLGGLLLILAVVYMKRKQRREYAQDPYLHHPDTLTHRPPFQEHKTAMMINIHSEDSPHWDHVSKSLDSEDTLLRDPSCRTCALPYSQQQLIPLGPPPSTERTGPADVPIAHRDPVSRQHIYECPKFS